MPARYAHLFAGAAGVLDSHRGLDYGALEVARAFGRRLGVAPFTATTTRLVVDLNRSSYHRNVFSEYTRALTDGERAAAMAAHYWPYRNAVEAVVEDAVATGRAVLHVSSHSFTPVLRGAARCASSTRGTSQCAPRRPISSFGATIHIAAPRTHW